MVITTSVSPLSISDSLKISTSGRLKLNTGSTLNQVSILINDGTLATDGTITLTGKTLKGTGTVDGNLVNNGIIIPGNPLGSLTVTHNFTQLASGILNIDIGGPVQGKPMMCFMLTELLRSVE